MKSKLCFVAMVALAVLLSVVWIAYAQGPGETRYLVLDDGITVISGDGVNYYVKDGYVDLPSGVGWVQSLITAGTIQPIYAVFEVSGEMVSKKVVSEEAVSDDVTIANNVTISPQTAISLTEGAVITPTGMYQPIESAGNVTITSIVTGTAGDLLYLVNTAAHTIKLPDAGTLKLSGELDLGQYDTVLLMSDGTNWIQIATSNN